MLYLIYSQQDAHKQAVDCTLYIVQKIQQQQQQQSLNAKEQQIDK